MQFSRDHRRDVPVSGVRSKSRKLADSVKQSSHDAASDRRTLIADVALRLLGERGARGLTHRAVDQAAGLPLGSTSYYCRRREDLLALAFRRHAELDLQAIATQATVHASIPLSIEGVANIMTEQLERWRKLKYPHQLSTRFEIFLAASRNPALAAVTSESRSRFLDTLREVLRALKVRDPSLVAAALIAFTEGILLDQARNGGKPILNRLALRTVLRAILQSSEERKKDSVAIRNF
jgi:DNA-binding transcriptional regulator YbjK